MSLSNKLFMTFSATDANAPAVDGKAMSGTATIYSCMVSGKDRQGLSGQVFWTGTPTGVFVLQYSNKQVPDESNDNDWTADTATFTQPAGSAASSGFAATSAGSIQGLHHRLKYTNASGAGIVTGFSYAPQFR